MLGKRANCQALVSLTLARDEVPVALGLRLFLPESWTGDVVRMASAGVPEPFQAPRSKIQIAFRRSIASRRRACASAWCWPMPAMVCPRPSARA